LPELAAKLADNCRRLRNALLVTLPERHDLGLEDDGRESASRVRQCLGFFACDGSVPAFHMCAPCAHSGRRYGGLSSLTFSHF